MPNSAPARRVRIESIDALRGLAMFFMALDHVRDYFGASTVNPTNLATTSYALFFTRWITHFCAPTFFLLTGTAAYLSGRRRGPSDLAHFLATRGIWLILLDTVVLRCLGWQFNFDFRANYVIILWALGWAMIVLSLFVRWPPIVAGVFGLALILIHNLFDGVSAASLGAASPLWIILHQPGIIFNRPPHVVFVGYPLIPWVGVTAAGYALGPLFEWEPERRRALLLRVGAAAVCGFIVLRSLNVYGDPARWAPQRSTGFTILSFINTTKYPPSLLFLLMTLGPAVLVLCALDRGIPRWLRPVVVLGKVPLFYFALHVVLIHSLALVVCWARYGEIHWVFQSPTLDKYPFTQPPGWPLSLPWIYAIWLSVVAMLWPLCRWFASVKARRREWWLSYL